MARKARANSSGVSGAAAEFRASGWRLDARFFGAGAYGFAVMVMHFQSPALLAKYLDAAGVSGDMAWHSGTFHVAGANGANLGTGKYVEVSRKTDGKWLMIRDVWNNDAPPAAAAPAAQPAAPAKKK